MRTSRKTLTAMALVGGLALAISAADAQAQCHSGYSGGYSGRSYYAPAPAVYHRPVYAPTRYVTYPSYPAYQHYAPPVYYPRPVVYSRPACYPNYYYSRPVYYSQPGFAFSINW